MQPTYYYDRYNRRYVYPTGSVHPASAQPGSSMTAQAPPNAQSYGFQPYGYSTAYGLSQQYASSYNSTLQPNTGLHGMPGNGPPLAYGAPQSAYGPGPSSLGPAVGYAMPSSSSYASSSASFGGYAAPSFQPQFLTPYYGQPGQSPYLPPSAIDPRASAYHPLHGVAGPHAPRVSAAPPQTTQLPPVVHQQQPIAPPTMAISASYNNSTNQRGRGSAARGGGSGQGRRGGRGGNQSAGRGSQSAEAGTSGGLVQAMNGLSLRSEKNMPGSKANQRATKGIGRSLSRSKAGKEALMAEQPLEAVIIPKKINLLDLPNELLEPILTEAILRHSMGGINMFKRQAMERRLSKVCKRFATIMSATDAVSRLAIKLPGGKKKMKQHSLLQRIKQDEGFRARIKWLALEPTVNRHAGESDISKAQIAEAVRLLQRLPDLRSVQINTPNFRNVPLMLAIITPEKVLLSLSLFGQPAIVTDRQIEDCSEVIYFIRQLLEQTPIFNLFQCALPMIGGLFFARSGTVSATRHGEPPLFEHEHEYNHRLDINLFADLMSSDTCFNATLFDVAGKLAVDTIMVSQGDCPCGDEDCTPITGEVYEDVTFIDVAGGTFLETVDQAAEFFEQFPNIETLHLARIAFKPPSTSSQLLDHEYTVKRFLELLPRLPMSLRAETSKMTLVRLPGKPDLCRDIEVGMQNNGIRFEWLEETLLENEDFEISV